MKLENLLATLKEAEKELSNMAVEHTAKSKEYAKQSRETGDYELFKKFYDYDSSALGAENISDGIIDLIRVIEENMSRIK